MMLAMTDLVRTATLPAAVRVERGAGGLPRIAIATPQGTAELYFQGAHLTAWHPTHSDPVLWMSRESRFEPDVAIRGGVPICFPWFGAHATDPAAPAHGFARLLPWTLIDASEQAQGVVTVTLELASAQATTALAAAWPHTFQARYRVTVGPTLTMDLDIHNVGATPFTYEEALHSYFAVQDIHDVTVTGTEHTAYLDKVAGFARVQQGPDPISFTGETDRVYLDAREPCVIHDPGLRRAITVRKAQSAATVVWNPWIDKARAMKDFGDDEWPRMVCVETCNVNVQARTLAPGERHTMTAIIEASSL
jgi:glucose-6-phosphate 1-epimerase